MNNPIAIFNSLREMYLRYLDSPFDLRYSDLVNERRQLLDVDGRIFREPLIEPVPLYQDCGQTFSGMVQPILGGIWTQQEITDLANFVSLELFPETPPNIRRPYTHQRDVFCESAVNGHDVVVTTGTGSGKTECFLLPILAALIRESASWIPASPRPHQWDWWNYGNQRVSQRGHEVPADRPAAMRALILYPLNALVEDQLGRMRNTLDGPSARQWFQSCRGGNCFYFGRYTGRTPVPGLANPSKVKRLREELIDAELAIQQVTGTPAERFFPRLDGGEMRSRWDMQGSPPDILITNYSMLNIMLMRSLEAPIFDLTRQWLAADRSRVFHLIVDELHTYRGTPGTEVAYLLRVLFERLGLSADSPQLRIIASSASIAGDDSGRAYLEEFFGRDRDRFRIIPGDPAPVEPGAVDCVQTHAIAFRDLGRSFRLTSPENLSAPIGVFCQATGAAIQIGAAPEQMLGAALDHVTAPSALRVVCSTPDSNVVRPRTSQEIGTTLFPALPVNARMEAVEGLLAGLGIGHNPNGGALLPVRAHLFFRNLQGLWVCPNPDCTAAPARTGPCPVGSFHYTPALTCSCGSRILELLYCEPCGEVFLG
ncbi:MAG: DEAD/DEAH box helicase, partial [Candidatus Binatia bacterium]